MFDFARHLPPQVTQELRLQANPAPRSLHVNLDVLDLEETAPGCTVTGEPYHDVIAVRHLALRIRAVFGWFLVGRRSRVPLTRAGRFSA